jgi:predicted DNA-binding transcriptional regulator AlpA
MPPLLTREDLCKLFCISMSTLDRWIQQGRIPPADVRLGPRCPRWRRETIEKLLQTVHVGLC